MNPLDLVTQLVGIAAMIVAIATYQFKSPKAIAVIQLCSSLLWFIQFMMLGAYVGALLNIIAILRSVVYSNRERFHAERKIWIFIFTALAVIPYILTFTLFGKEPTFFHLIIEFFPLIGVTAFNIGYYLNDSGKFRICSLVSSPVWMVYDIVSKSVGGTVCEIFSLCSIIIGMLRYDRKKNNSSKGVYHVNPSS